MTKADLIEEVSRVVEMTRKESEVIVEAIFDSIVRSLRHAAKIEIRGVGRFTAHSGGKRQARIRKKIRKPVRAWKCLRRRFLTSSPAKN